MCSFIYVCVCVVGVVFVCELGMFVGCSSLKGCVWMYLLAVFIYNVGFFGLNCCLICVGVVACLLACVCLLLWVGVCGCVDCKLCVCLVVVCLVLYVVFGVFGI